MKAAATRPRRIRTPNLRAGRAPSFKAFAQLCEATLGVSHHGFAQPLIIVALATPTARAEFRHGRKPLSVDRCLTLTGSRRRK